MSCNFPVLCYRDKNGPNSETGKWPLVSNPSDGCVDLPVVRPCGKCIGCRLDYSRSKAVRAMHESTLHDANSFVTLTYDPDTLPFGSGSLGWPTLVKRDLQLFWKRLRKIIHPIRIRYMACGEYGDSTERPHYHAIIFGYDFSDDREIWKRGRNPLYVSSTLSDAWKLGHAVVGDLSFESAAYVASYTVKKLNGQMGIEAYEKCGRIPPFGSMSLKPGIGRGWIEKWSEDVYAHDAINVNGHLQRPPRAYDKFFESNGGDLAFVLRNRQKLVQERLDRNLVTPSVNNEMKLKNSLAKKIQKL